MKMDTSKIEGYQNMTPEQKVAALEAFEVDLSDMVRKEAFDKTASELAAAKKQLRDSLSESERAKVEREEELANLRAEVELMRTERAEANNKARFIGLGLSEADAAKCSKALTEGKTDAIFDLLGSWIKTHDKEIVAGMQRNSAKPPAGGENKPLSKEDFRKLPAEQRLKYATEHPEEYKQIYGG